jgi:hypothetical protein
VPETDGAAELVQSVETAAAPELAEFEDHAGHLARNSRAASTWRAYDSDLRNLRTWCAERGLGAVPATSARWRATWPTWRRHRPTTIRRGLAAITVAHHVAGLDSPTADAGLRAVTV